MKCKFTNEKRWLSLLLALSLTLGCVPFGIIAAEASADITEPAAEVTEAPTETTETTEETAEATEETAEDPILQEPHTHEYEPTVTAPTDTEQGYTAYICICGDSYVADYVDAAGAHTYENGICIGCGEEDYSELNLNGLNVLCLGDSITAGQGLTTETRWTNVLASKYGWNLTNKSQGGIALSSYYYTANGKSDVSIAKKAEILKTMTTKPDVIIVWGGHNDTSYRYSPLGTWDDETTDSFKGALKYIAELADEYAPDATLFVLTPLWTTEAPSTLKVPENTTDNNWMFVDAIYEGAEAYGWIPVNMDLCGITPFTKSGLLLDNIHPNEAGTEKIVAYLSAELVSYSETSKKEAIIFNASAVSMKPGESTTLKAVLSPRSGTGTMTFTWSSSDSSVATVDASGKITAVAPGTAVITATAPNGTSADISVSVVCAHTYESTVTAPTCTEQGYTTYTCECGDSYVDDYTGVAAHSFAGGRCTLCGMVGGTCGDDLCWVYDSNTQRLIITGTGAMADYEWETAPWWEYLYEIRAVELPDGLTHIGQYAFGNAWQMTEAEIPDSVTSLGLGAFCSTAITQIVIPEGVTVLPDSAFLTIPTLQKITLPSALTQIGPHAFGGDVSLKDVILPEGVTAIGWGAFYGCTSLTGIRLPAGVTEIAPEAFADSTNLTEIWFTGDAPALGADMFRETILTAYYPAGNATWTQNVRQNYGGSVTWVPYCYDGHDWQDATCAAPKTCKNCGQTEDSALKHDYDSVVTPPTCTAEGYTTHTCSRCGDDYTDSYTPAAGHNWRNPDVIIKECTLCGHIEGGYRVDVEAAEVWIDGVKFAAREDENGRFVQLEHTHAKILTVYSYNDAAASDPHAKYPTGMQVWRLEFENGGYVSTYVPEFENLLQYVGSSIRVTGIKGIRMITGISKALRQQLMDGSLGYTLVEYGTCVAWASDLNGNAPVLGDGKTMSNYAYKQGTADPIFADTGSVIQYTNVLVGFTDDQLAGDLVLRPYLILKDSEGHQFTIYGGCVQRSIGYIAKQNQNTFPEGTKADAYIEDIISKVYK